MKNFVTMIVKDTGKVEYLRPFIHIGLDWMITSCRVSARDALFS